jgi:heptosyltransferase-1
VRVLIVKLSSMGDVIHALPVVQDLRRAFPNAIIDWVVEPAFAPLVRRAAGIGDVIDMPLRRWAEGWWTGAVRAEFLQFRSRLRRERYQAILDLQGLTKSALVSALARGHRFALANKTEGSGYEPPTRWVAQTAIAVEPHIHVLDRSRVLAAKALGYQFAGPPSFGLRPLSHGAALDPSASRTVAFLHGTSRDDKLWPEEHWLALGRQFIAEGWRVGLPQGSAEEAERARRLAAALGKRASVWPLMPLGALMDKLATCQGAIGVDSGLSHLAVALDLPHVQLYNLPTAWRTGPLEAHGHRHQVALTAQPTPTVPAVREAWRDVLASAQGHPPRRAAEDEDIHSDTQAMTQASDFADDGDIGSSGTSTGLASRRPPASSVA